MWLRTVLAGVVAAIVTVALVTVVPSRAATPSRLTPGPVEVKPDVNGDGFAVRLFNPTSRKLHVSVTMKDPYGWPVDEFPNESIINPGKVSWFYSDCASYCSGLPVISTSQVIASGYLNSVAAGSIVELSPGDFHRF